MKFGGESAEESWEVPQEEGGLAPLYSPQAISAKEVYV